MFKKVLILAIVALIFISLIQTAQLWKPIIYIEINHNKTQLLDSISELKETSRIERIVGLSDSIIANLIKLILPKINKIKSNYYYVIDYCIDHNKKNEMLRSMTLNEWYEFKQNKNSWNILAWASTSLWTKSWPYVSNDYRIEELDQIEKDILRE